MPFYEYECRACKFYTEVMQKISDAPLSKCPSCGKRALKKLVSAPVFRLKGGGWYETDFKSDKESKRNLLGADKEESKPETKSDSAPAKAAEAPAKEAKAPDSKPAATPAARPARTAKRHAGQARGTSRAKSARRRPKR
jgi:putative FmdB family regulatory protein